MKKNKKTIIIIAIVLILIIGGAVGFYCYQQILKGSNKNETNVAQQEINLDLQDNEEDDDFFDDFFDN